MASPSRLLAQRLELLGRWAGYQGQDRPPNQAHAHPGHTPKPGDLVMEKPGLSVLAPQFRKNRGLILWRILDSEDFADREIVRSFYGRTTHNDRVDCLVALVEDDGDTFFMPVDIKKLRRLEQSELAELAPFLDSKLPGAVSADDLVEA